MPISRERGRREAAAGAPLAKASGVTKRSSAASDG
jgi:hypothetical protein